MRVGVVGEVSISNGPDAVTGARVGGPRVRTALVALALAEHPLAPDRLAAMVWGEDPPPTWPDALRGLIRSIRTAGAAVGLGGQALVVTTGNGYRLAADVEVDLRVDAAALHTAEHLLAEERYAAAEQAAALIDTSQSEILPGVDADWLAAPRAAHEQRLVRALLLRAQVAGRNGRPGEGIEPARLAVDRAPLNEQAHRVYIEALDRAGDRAGAVRAYERCRSVLAEQLGIDPSTDTVNAYLAALHSDGLSGGHRLPPRSTEMIGREVELADLRVRIATPGLVTVTGKGGVGKSRLALQAAADSVGFDGGTFWVSLVSAVDDELVAASAALAIGAQIGADDPTEALCRQLAPAGRVLVVLDGCEAVLDGVASLVAAVQSECPSATILATSRMSLSVDGEQLVRIGSLPVPDATDPVGMLANPAIRLLTERMLGHGQRLRIDDETSAPLAALCRRCEGLPLALELVAAQLAAGPPGDLLDVLGAAAGESDALRSVARRSYELLSDQEAQVFRRFAVLDGPVSLPLVRAVVAGEGIAPIRVVRILRRLTESGLLIADRSGARWRYQQDDDLHRFALDELDAAGESAATLDRLAGAVRDLLPELAKTPPAVFADQVTDAIGCVRAVFSAALNGRLERDRGLELGYRLHRYWASSNVAEGRFWLRRLLADKPDAHWAGHAWFGLGYLSYWSGDVGEAMPQLEEAVRLLRGVDDATAGRALIYLSGMADDLDRGAEAVESVRMCIELTRPLGDVDLRVGAEMAMGCILAERADPAAAGFVAQAVELCAEGGSVDSLSCALATSAMVCWQVGDLASARAYLDRARPLLADKKRISRVVFLSMSAAVALADGDAEAAIEFGTRSDAEASELGVEREVPLIRAVLARALLAAADPLEAARWARAALTAAAALTFRFPLADCLEAAALVLLELGSARLVDVRDLLTAAAAIRAAGDRPGPPPLRPAIDAALGRLPARSGVVLSTDEAVALALRLLTVSSN
ncbi:MAG: ATP-binding protein [Jatrophihabitans sp.]